MRRRLFGATLLGVATVVGCGEAHDVSAPGAPPNVVAALARSAESQQRVTGSATLVLPSFGDALERYSVSAIRHNDGAVTGEFEEFSEQDGGQRIHASVVCFRVDGNTARLAARLEKSNVPFGPVGSYVIWSVIDNGQGRNALPDMTTDIYFGGTRAQADFHCDVGFPLTPFYPSLRGNLQVQE